MSVLRTILLLSIGAFFLSVPLASRVAAETVIVAGENGLAGEVGEPGSIGGNGTDGTSATATPVLEFQDNIAEATGGNGGAGGRGGTALPGPGEIGGTGGNGGNGADAVATAFTLNEDVVRAVAIGGRAGSAGQGGRGAHFVYDGPSGQAGLIGGNATAPRGLIGRRMMAFRRRVSTAQPGTRIEALARLAVRGEQFEASTQITELDISPVTPESGADLALAFSDLRRVGDGFDSLSFRLEILGEAFGEEVVFDDFETAQIFFDSVIMLGQAYRENSPGFFVPAVRAIFEVTTLPGQEFSLNVAAVVVPEPSTALSDWSS